MWPQLPFPISPVKGFADFLAPLPSRVHNACSRTLSRRTVESVSPFLDWELLKSRDHVLCCSLVSPKHTAWHRGSGYRSADQKRVLALYPGISLVLVPAVPGL